MHDSPQITLFTTIHFHTNPIKHHILKTPANKPSPKSRKTRKQRRCISSYSKKTKRLIFTTEIPPKSRPPKIPLFGALGTVFQKKAKKQQEKT
jgi:hypothetical protein